MDTVMMITGWFFFLSIGTLAFLMCLSAAPEFIAKFFDHWRLAYELKRRLSWDLISLAENDESIFDVMVRLIAEKKEQQK